jgi:hypothetical protein
LVEIVELDLKEGTGGITQGEWVQRENWKFQLERLAQLAMKIESYSVKGS